MTQRGRWLLTVALAATVAGCAAPVKPPPVVATLPPPSPPPPVMPAGGYAGMDIPAKRDDGSYVTPNFQMTDAAAVWHLRGALNVSALACEKAGGSTVDGYNAWLTAHGPALDGYMKQYRHEWEETGWSDWEAAYDNQQTRLYNFYTQPAIRTAFCAAAREEMALVDAVPDAQLPAHAREALARLDQPFITFFTAFDRWQDHVGRVTPPKVVATLPPPAPAPVTPPDTAVAVVPVEGSGTETAVVAAPVEVPAPAAQPAAEDAPAADAGNAAAAM